MPYMPDFLEKQLQAFEELPFGVLDATALAQFSMIGAQDVMPSLPGNVERKGLRKLVKPSAGPGVRFVTMLRAEHFPEMFANLMSPDKAKRTLFGVSASPRFREMVALDYQAVFDEREQVQFGAMTFAYKNLFTCVAFRGTDASMVGWREDFNMAFTMPVPAQDLALEYLEAIARQSHLPKTLYVVGHSKGGNLAEYAALRASKKLQKRISHVYNFDGPGFKIGTFDEEDYAPLKGKLTKIVPEESMVGIMLESEAPLKVANSNAQGFDQHSAYTWEVNDELTDYAYLPKLPKSTQGTAKSLHAWLSDYDDEQRERIVDAFFEAVKVSDAKNPVELISGGKKGATLLFNAARRLDKADRDILLSAARSFVKALSQNANGSVGLAATAITNLVDMLPSKEDA